MLILAGGAAGAQAINVAVAPALTRLYGPTQIAQLGLFLSFIYVASIVVSLRYEQAIVVPRSDAVAARLAILAMALVPVGAAAATLVLVALAAGDVANYGALPAAAMPLATVALLASGVFAALRYWLIRSHAYRAISEVQLSQGIARAIGQVGLGLAGAGVLGLLVADVMGRLAGIARLLGAAASGLGRASREPRPPTHAIARDHWRFPVLGVPSGLLNAAAIALPVPLLAAAYGLPLAGQFALVQRVLGLPLTVIGASVGDAFLARLSEQVRQDPAAALSMFRGVALSLATIALPGAAALVLLGPPAFALIFGPDWADAGQMAALLAPWFVAALVVSPLSRVALVFQTQASKLVYDLASLTAVLGSLIVGPALGLGWQGAISAFALLQVSAYAVFLVVLYRIVRGAAAT